VLAVLLPAGLALLVHRRVLGLFFSPDDLIQLERVTGIVPQPPLLWRLLSLRLYESALWPVLGPEPLGWHLITLLGHAANAALVSLWALRLGSPPAVALLTASAFAATPIAITTVSQVSTMSEVLALGFSLATLLLLGSDRPGRPWAGVAAHAAALLSKENVFLVPLVGAICGRPALGPPVPWRAIGAALAVSVAAWLYVARVLLRPDGFLGGAAYGFALGPHLLTNLLTYAAWSARFFAGPSEPPHAALELGAGAALLAALALYAWRSGSRAARCGLALWAATLLPVLPLRFQVHPHYAYVAFAGWALALAVAAHALLARLTAPGASRSARPAVAWIGALLLVVACAAAGEAAWARRTWGRLAALQLPLDSMLRKMEYAGNAWRGLKESLPPEPVRLVVVTPPGDSAVYSVRTGQRVAAATGGAPRYDMLSAVLDGGRALRALFPRLEAVRIDERVEPADSTACLATASINGRIVAFGAGPTGHVALASQWARAGLIEPARAHLAQAAELYPGSGEIALAEAVIGAPDRAAAAEALRGVIARFPGSPVARRAAELLSQLEAVEARPAAPR